LIVSDDGTNVAEMGAMRFPPSEDLLFHYAEHFGFTFLEDFPDPGTVPTIVSFQGKSQIWLNNRTLEGFETVHDGWLAFVKNGIIRKDADGKAQTVLSGPEDRQLMLKSPNKAERETVKEHWQAWLDTFGGLTFLQGLKVIFTEGTLGDIPGGKVWNDKTTTASGRWESDLAG
jgi:tryptophan 2-monooxygenase